MTDYVLVISFPTDAATDEHVQSRLFLSDSSGNSSSEGDGFTTVTAYFDSVEARSVAPGTNRPESCSAKAFAAPEIPLTKFAREHSAKTATRRGARPGARRESLDKYVRRLEEQGDDETGGGGEAGDGDDQGSDPPCHRGVCHDDPPLGPAGCASPVAGRMLARGRL